jgi:hypothetical protein
MKQVDSILLEELTKEMAKKERLDGEIARVRDIKHTDCVNALSGYITKTEDRINLLLLAME